LVLLGVVLSHIPEKNAQRTRPESARQHLDLILNLSRCGANGYAYDIWFVILTAIFAKPASQTDFSQSRPKNPVPHDISWIWRAIGVIVSVLHYVDMAS
jgi:hypothetical protein